MHPLLSKNEVYKLETLDAMQVRYQGFGKELYQRMQIELPEVYDRLIFYKAIRNQTTDSYAVYNDKTNPFAIQLDPDISLIILWNSATHIEITSWSPDACGEAIEFIKTNLLSAT
jgi:hypothetical protein